MEKIQEMSMLEVAIKLMEDTNGSLPISKIISETLNLKGIEDPNGEFAAQLYIDITSSSRFVYMGNEEWDLKIRQSLDQYDKDGSAFNTAVEEEPEEEEEESFDEKYGTSALEEETFDETDTYDEDEIEHDEIVTDVYDEEEDSYDDDDEESDYMDEDSYNEYMDDYEDMYDKD